MDIVGGMFGFVGSALGGIFGFHSAQNKANLERQQIEDRKRQIRQKNERLIKTHSSSGSGSVDLSSVNSDYLQSELGDYVQDPNPWAYAIAAITSAVSNGMDGYVSGGKIK
jgi:hypothetical protein